MIVRSPLKVAIAQLYARNAFGPSNWYSKTPQSPFTDGASPESSWALPYNALRSQIWNIQGRGCVFFQIEWVASLIDDFNIAPSDITFFSDNTEKTKLGQGLGVTVVTNIGDLLEMQKFNYVLKNAPYDRGIDVGITLPFHNIGPHAAFSVIGNQILTDDGICFDVLPCNFMCLPTAKGYRDWLLSNFDILNITLWDNSQRQVFDINMSDILTMVTRKSSSPNNRNVEWVAYGSQPFTVDLTRYDFWPMYKSPLSVAIFDSIMSSRVSDLLEFDGGDFDSIKTPSKYFISANLARQGQRQNPNPQKQFQKDVIKNIKQPIWLGYSTQQEKDYQFEWIGTKHYAYALSMVQSTPKNQPFLFSLLGEHNFQNNNFVSHFKVTPTQDQEIEQWYNSVK